MHGNRPLAALAALLLRAYMTQRLLMLLPLGLLGLPCSLSLSHHLLQLRLSLGFLSLFEL